MAGPNPVFQISNSQLNIFLKMNLAYVLIVYLCLCTATITAAQQSTHTPAKGKIYSESLLDSILHIQTKDDCKNNSQKLRLALTEHKTIFFWAKLDPSFGTNHYKLLTIKQQNNLFAVLKLSTSGNQKKWNLHFNPASGPTAPIFVPQFHEAQSPTTWFYTQLSLNPDSSLTIITKFDLTTDTPPQTLTIPNLPTLQHSEINIACSQNQPLFRGQ